MRLFSYSDQITNKLLIKKNYFYLKIVIKTILFTCQVTLDNDISIKLSNDFTHMLLDLWFCKNATHIAIYKIDSVERTYFTNQELSHICVDI